jgi:hypothetical protein
MVQGSGFKVQSSKKKTIPQNTVRQLSVAFKKE